MQSKGLVDASRSRPRRIVMGLALVVVAVVGGFSGCGLSTEGIPGNCSDDLDCPAPDPCKSGSCAPTGDCVFAGLPDGDPPIQVPGDCKRVTCKAGSPETTADPTDSDDGNPCTKDSCPGGVPQHQKLSGVACLEKGQCVDGVCEISCDAQSTSEDCEEGNPCTADSCDLTTNKCIHEPQHGKLVSNDDKGDCQQVVCIQDAATSVPDDDEVPEDNNECTKDSCQNGVKHNDGDPALKGTACGTNLAFKCNDKGNCVGCNDPGDCPGDDTECHHRTCINEVCGVDNDGLGKVVSNGQTGGDCQDVICNGMGDLTQQANNGDLPPDEGNPCTLDICSGGTPSHPPGNYDAPCSGGVCNLTGVCVQCNTTAECGPGPICKTTSCDGNSCTLADVPDGSDTKNDCNDAGQASCGTDGACNGAGACRMYSAGSVCVTTSCSGSNLVLADTCNGGGTCIDGGQMSCSPYNCVGASCKINCTSNGDCDGGHVCNTTTSACANPLGTTCSSGGECGSNHCVDFKCCQQSSCTTCKSCGSGSCQNDPPNTADPACPANNLCDGSGACKKIDGEPCTASTQCLSNNCCVGGTHNNMCEPTGGC